MTDREQLDLFFDRRRAAMVEDIRALVRVDSVKGEAYPGAPFGSGPAAAPTATAAKPFGNIFWSSATNINNHMIVIAPDVLSLRGGRSPTWQSVSLVHQPPLSKGGGTAKP